MHGNQWVLKIAVLKYYSVSKRGTTAKSNPKQATDPISLHTKFGDNSSNTFPLNERKPCVTPDIGRRTSDNGHRTAKKAKIIYPSPRGVDIIMPFIASYQVHSLIIAWRFKSNLPLTSVHKISYSDIIHKRSKRFSYFRSQLILHWSMKNN